MNETDLFAGGRRALIDEAAALIFDCDGTLVESGSLYGRAWQHGFAEGGRSMDMDWYRERAGLSESLLLDAYAEAHGLALDREAIVARMRRSFLGHLGELCEVSPICALAREYRGRKPMAVASGGPAAIVLPSLQALDLLSLFDAVVTVDDTGEPKPSPAIFLEAARRLGHDPADCLVFEDSDPGVEAARAGGLRCIDVRPLL